MILTTTLVDDRATLRSAPAGHHVSVAGATCVGHAPFHGTRVSSGSLRPRATAVGGDVRPGAGRPGERVADTPVVATQPKSVHVPMITDPAQDGPLSVRAWSPPV